jgi:toxin-antitoxin system PIN domain toxin
MILLDVNVLIYAFRADSERHGEFRTWLLEAVSGDAAFGLSEQVLASVVRITTHPKIYVKPSKVSEVFSFCDKLRELPNCALINPKVRHWEIFHRLCQQSDVKGNLVQDAWLAALAIESGCEWITTDRDYARFRGLRWRHPLEK